jgi:hypothetical protein
MSKYQWVVFSMAVCVMFSFLTPQVLAVSLSTSPTPTQKMIKPPLNPPTAGISLAVSPPFLNVSVKPGETVRTEFKVRNNNNFPEYLGVTLNKFQVGSNGNTVDLKSLPPHDEFASWVTLSDKQFILDPNQSRTVQVQITVPQNAALGYYYAFIIQRLKDAGVNQGAAISGGISVPILLNVQSGNAIRELKLVDLKTDKLIYEYLPATFSVVVENRGNIHTAPVGDVFIDSLWHKEVAAIPVNEGRGNVLPNSTRAFPVTWDDGFAVRVPKKSDEGQPLKDAAGHDEFTTHYDFARANKFRFGKYTAHVLMIYDNGERDIPLEARVSFWVIPWKIMLGLGVVGLLALVGIIGIIKSLIRRITKSSH